MNINIRRCMISDAHRIYELSMKELGYKFSEEQVEANVRRLIGVPTSLILVAEAGDEVVGFIHASNHEPVYAPPMKNILGLAVDPEYRKNGLGRMLVEAVEDWARETGAAGIRVNSGANMDSGLRFYKALGYDYIRTQYKFKKML